LWFAGMLENAVSHKHIERQADGRDEMTDGELKAILTQAMVDGGTTAAAVYAYYKPGAILRGTMSVAYHPNVSVPGMQQLTNTLSLLKV